MASLFLPLSFSLSFFFFFLFLGGVESVNSYPPKNVTIDSWGGGQFSSVYKGIYVDVNGDGVDDLVYSVFDYSRFKQTINEVYLFKRGKWHYAPQFVLPIHLFVTDWISGKWSTATRGTFVDLNGDNLIDIVYSVSDDSNKGGSFNLAFLNKGEGGEGEKKGEEGGGKGEKKGGEGGWEENPDYAPPEVMYVMDWFGGQFSSVVVGQFLELNGDSSSPELVYGNKDYSSSFDYDFNNVFEYVQEENEGWVENVGLTLPIEITRTMWLKGIFSGTKTGRFIDFNNDGYMDILYGYFDYSITGGETIDPKIYINKGGMGWEESKEMRLGREEYWFVGDLQGGYISSVERGAVEDVNGDGYLDLIFSNQEEENRKIVETVNTTISKVLLNVKGNHFTSSPSFLPPFPLILTNWANGRFSSVIRGQFLSLRGPSSSPILLYSTKDNNAFPLFFSLSISKAYKLKEGGEEWERAKEWELREPLGEIDLSSGIFSSFSRGSFVDLNGDMLLDVVYSTYDYSTFNLTINEVVFNNNGTGWEY